MGEPASARPQTVGGARVGAGRGGSGRKWFRVPWSGGGNCGVALVGGGDRERGEARGARGAAAAAAATGLVAAAGTSRPGERPSGGGRGEEAPARREGVSVAREGRSWGGGWGGG